MAARSAANVIQSVDRCLRLMDFVGQASQPVSINEIAAHLKIDRSNAFRLAHTLRCRGFLVQPPGTKQYLIGPAIRRVASARAWSRSLTWIARPHLASLAAEAGEAAHLAVLEGARMLVVDYETLNRAPCASGRVGGYEPIHCTALGKSLVSNLNRMELAELFGAKPLEANTKRSVDSLEALAEQCEQIRRRGYAIDDEEYMDRVRCIAAPVHDGCGGIVAAMGISAPADRLARRQFARVGQMVRQAAARLASEFGVPLTGETEHA